MVRPERTHGRTRHRRRIRQIDVDFLCLAVFGQRALPDDMACRIAEFRDFHMRGLGDAVTKGERFEPGGGLEVSAESLAPVA